MKCISKLFGSKNSAVCRAPAACAHTNNLPVIYETSRAEFKIFAIQSYLLVLYSILPHKSYNYI